ncbi:MAG: MarR family transcriptional regulator [Rubricoccaceae bacterium]
MRPLASAVTLSERLDAFTDALGRLKGHNTQMTGELSARYEGLSFQDIGTLIALQTHGPSRMGAVAMFLGLAPASTTPIVDRLEATGYAQRRRSDTDRRVWLVELTTKGHDAVAELDDLYRRSAAEMLAPLTADEQETFVRLFVKVADALDAADHQRQLDSD